MPGKTSRPLVAPLPARTRIRVPSCRSQNRLASARLIGGSAVVTSTSVATSRPDASVATSDALVSCVRLKNSATRARTTISSPTVGT